MYRMFIFRNPFHLETNGLWLREQYFTTCIEILRYEHTNTDEQDLKSRENTLIFILSIFSIGKLAFSFSFLLPLELREKIEKIPKISGFSKFEPPPISSEC